MGWWTDIAHRHSQSPNCGPAMRSHRGLVVHIAEGSYQGTINWQMNPDAGVSSHFVVSKQGDITQVVDTDIQSWCQIDGNGDWLSVENEGYTTDGGLSDAQVSANARILAKSASVYGHPIVVATCPDDKGLGHHSMGAECGYNWGHSECPGEDIKQQKPEIVRRASGEDGGDDMNDAQNNALVDCLNILTALGNGQTTATVHDKDGVLHIGQFYTKVADVVIEKAIAGLQATRHHHRQDMDGNE